jgi:hypothetical protein
LTGNVGVLTASCEVRAAQKEEKRTKPKRRTQREIILKKNYRLMKVVFFKCPGWIHEIETLF